jgi:hypothetical protein
MQHRFLLILLLFPLLSNAQNPFNYGQNKDVYFVSSLAIDTLGVNPIYIISGYTNGETGGMHENWDMNIMSFDEEGFQDAWHIMYTDTPYIPDFDSLLSGSRYINGYSCVVEDGVLQSHGGQGYGSFEYTDIVQRNNSFSLSHTYCAGHCGDLSGEYFSINYFNSSGQVSYTVRFEEIFPAKEESLYDSLFEMNFPNHLKRDTIYYHYDEKGQIKDFFKNNLDTADIFTKLNMHGNYDQPHYQCRTEENNLSQHLLKKLGFAPRVLILEIYQYGALFLFFDPKSHQYYHTATMVLEK